jgi:uncharacterized protein (DUF1330 family)
MASRHPGFSFAAALRQVNLAAFIDDFLEMDRMAAYWMSRCKVHDSVEYKKYTDRVPGIIAKFNGRVLARGGRYQVMEGTQEFHRFVVIEFPSLEDAVACHRSAEYQAAAAFRRNGAGEVDLAIVEGGDATT